MTTSAAGALASAPASRPNAGVPNLALAWAELMLRGFCAAGVRDLVLSPGSRSTPLAIAAARIEALRVHVVIDERQAGFFALGQARVTQRPSVVVCTSGTAAAHYLPALLEAREAGVPLIVLTADRPWEAQHVASAQTTDQTRMFGEAVRGAFELACPEDEPLALAALARTAAQATALACAPRPGGVHVNAPFRKPLEPSAEPIPSFACTPPLQLRTTATLHPEARESLRALCAGKRRVLLLAGPALLQDTQVAQDGTFDVLRERGVVIAAESASGLRAYSLAHLDAFCTFLRDPANAPDLVLCVGLPPVSSALQAWLAQATMTRVVIAEHVWADPWSSARAIVPLGRAEGLAEILPLLDELDRPWAARAHALDARLERAQRARHAAALLESTVARVVAAHASWLLVGNSLPIRDLDVFGGKHRATVLHQRGVAGIDGLLAGACGSAAVCNAPLMVYLGDVSFLHDVGALALLTEVKAPLPVVVVNNDGGRIFQELPLGAREGLEAIVDRHFVTPHGRDLSAIARGFGLHAHRVHDEPTLQHTLEAALRAPHATVIEVVVDAHASKHDRAAWRREAEAIVREVLA